MLELLAAATGVELGKLILEQVLNLGKSALEDYVKDFFKDCIQSGVARANAETLKKPMAEAIGFFIQRFVKELQLNDVPESSIEHHFKATIKQFVQDKAVRPILGKAFETDCKQIDYAQLQRIWTQQYQNTGWQFPAEFDWRRVAKEYVIEVQGIVKANPELRSLLHTELLEEIARNTAQLSPGFDVARYRESLQSSYGYLKLYTLDSTDRADQIKLWNLFIEQTVREALPPMRYELPLDLKRQLQEQGQLDDLSAEALEHYRYQYFQQPSCKVLAAVADASHAVILGDPGSGKSTLLQYLALEWVEGKTETLPLLIELRDYALAQSANFLEFLHRGRGADWQFDQQQLHQHLLEHPTQVMFDGLDEVFDRPTQAAVIDDIIRFAQQYPQAKVLVTSRIIGYNPERFQHAGFRQFTIQPLDQTEIHEFIDRWYDLAMGNDADKARLKQRLKDAIENSKAIANLADNPLLLTMMAILNRRQELPRDRADLYDQASRVLLYHWDVDHKRLHLPMDAIGRREKQEMLRLIAYEMQAGEEGLKGNLIGVDRLTRILTGYLREQGFSEPREKANQLIQQLRERNFILCYRGADSYGYVHRTFLEYFCALEIVNQFEKRRSISFEQLRDEVFGQHWQDETWHEVLRLICGMVDEETAAGIIAYLMKQRGIARIRYGGALAIFSKYGNLFLAADCFEEIRNIPKNQTVSINLLTALRNLCHKEHLEYGVGEFAVNRIVKIWKNHPDTLPWLLEFAQLDLDRDSLAQRTAVSELARGWKENPEIRSWIQTCASSNKNWILRDTALEVIGENWAGDLDMLPILQKSAEQDQHKGVRGTAVDLLAQSWGNYSSVISILISRAQVDDSWMVRLFATIGMAAMCQSQPEWFDFFYQRAIHDPFEREDTIDDNPRQIALEALLTHYPTYSKTLELLRDRAINDPDERLRAWAQKKLKIHDQNQ